MKRNLSLVVLFLLFFCYAVGCSVDLPQPPNRTFPAWFKEHVKSCDDGCDVPRRFLLRIRQRPDSLVNQRLCDEAADRLNDVLNGNSIWKVVTDGKYDYIGKSIPGYKWNVDYQTWEKDNG